MDIQLFRTFLTVAKLGNMTQAAEILNFTQPTVTSQIRALEEHFGVMLFERVGKKLYITEFGKQLIRYSETILSAYQEACETLNTTTGNVNLGASTAMVNYLLIPIFEEFQQEFCHNSVSIEMCANTAAVVRGVLENRFDLGFIHNAVAETQLVQSEIYQEKLIWVATPRLLKKYDYSDAVEAYPLLAYKAGGFFCTLYKEVLREKDFHSVIEYTDSEAIKKGVLDSLGIGAVPLTMVEPYLKSGELEEFPNMLRMDFTIRVIFRKDKLLSRSLLRFLEIAKGQLGFSLELHPMKNR